MRLPQRKAQLLRTHQDDGTIHLTKSGMQRLEREIADLKRQQPQIIEEVERYAQLGDFSENAEYQDAKARLRRLQAHLFLLQDRLKRATLIETETSGSGIASLGSTVLVETAGKQRTYQIVGPHEAHPSQGRISHLSPLGSALLGHTAGDCVTVETPDGTVEYLIQGVT